MIFWLIAVLCIFEVYGKQWDGNMVKDSQKVNVTVYIESYCPCSGQWQFDFQKYIVNTTIQDITTLYRYWDGTAHADGNVTCFHGPDECSANQLNECVQNMTDTWQLWLNYTACIDGYCSPKVDLQYCQYQYDIGPRKNSSRGLKQEELCAQKYNLDWNKINECSTSQAGYKLLWESAKHGNEAHEEYGIEGLPVVWVNESRFSTFWDCDAYETKMVPLVERICDVYKSMNNGPLPPDCPSQ